MKRALTDANNREFILAYEAECVRAVRQFVGDRGRDLERKGRVVTEVGLTGWAPETKIVVIFREGETTDRWEWDVWEERNYPPGTELPEPNYAWTVANLVVADLEE